MYKDQRKHTTSGKRFQKALDIRGESYTSLAKRLNITKASISAWPKSDISKASAGNVLKACKVLRIRIEWLLNGIGQMEASSGEGWDQQRLSSLIELLNKYDGPTLNSKQKAFVLEYFYFDNDVKVDPKAFKSLFNKIDILAKGAA